MLRLAVVLGVTWLSASAGAQDFYRDHRLVEVELTSPADLEAMLAVSDDHWSEGLHLGWLPFRVPPDRMDELDATGLGYVVLHADLQQLVDRERAEIAAAAELRDLAWFNAYKNLTQINAKLDEWAAARPDLVTKFSIGSSIQGRPIYALRIGDPTGDPERPVLLFNGCQHAREWISPMTVMYLADQLIELQPTDAQIADLLVDVEFLIIPVVNPDGYEYSWSGSGQRFWRKNRRDNGNGTFGVDLNRNWDSGWAGPGASTTPSSDTYCGTAPFSEPETQALRDLYLSEPRIRASIDFHSFSQLVLRPWGSVEAEPAEPDRTILRSLGDGIAADIFAVFGTTYVSQPVYDLYLASGGASDWAYLNGAWGLSIELRPESGSSDGFAPPASEILPTAIENFAAVRALGERIAAGLELDHAPPQNLTPAVPNAVAVQVLEVGGFVQTATLHARVGASGPFTPIAMSPAGLTGYAADLPAAPCGEIVQYYFEALAEDGRVVTLPASAPAARFAAWSLAETVLRLDDMETNPGWTVGGPGDNATTGIWTRVNPVGNAAQPEDDTTPAPGVNCWVTGQSAVGGAAGDNDVDNGTTTLRTAAIDLTGDPDARIEYWRWYSNHTGAAPGQDTFRVEISPDGTNWTLVESVGPTGPQTQGGWYFHSFRPADFITPSAATQVRFIASDLGQGSVVDAAVDDFRVSVTACPTDCPGDATGDGVIDLDDLLVVLGGFGTTLTDDGFAAAADFDRSGAIVLDDLLIVLGNFGGLCP